MADNEYPKASYRLGTQIDVWGRMMDVRVLADAADEASAIREGWSLHPLDVTDEKPLTAEVVPVDAPRPRGRPPKIRMNDDGAA